MTRREQNRAEVRASWQRLKKRPLALILLAVWLMGWGMVAAAIVAMLARL
jgi:type VI protein secretion system component VasF